jgi:iron(III) transport system substrate-binding protein
MLRNLSILALLALIVALPFVFRKPPPQGEWKAGDPTLVIVSPHNEAIRYEFGRAFSLWHKEKFGKPVKIDWRNIGGTTEISRYLASQYADATKAWWTSRRPTGSETIDTRWPATATDDLTRPAPPADPLSAEIYKAYRETDSADAISSNIDLFFGGGEFDHSNAFRSGFAVKVRDQLPPQLFKDSGVDQIPATLSGETWVTDSVMGNVVSTFGIIYNVDRLKDLGVENAPKQWTDLADYKYYRQVGLADPTKSGSIAKAFEMIVHQQMYDAAAAYIERNSDAKDRIPADVIAAYEKRIADYIKEKGKTYQRGDVPDDLKDYQAALEKGFENGLVLIQKIAGNARYFTDSASKVPIDVSMGDAAIGMAIDFYGRYQAESSRAADGTERMKFVTPVGGTSVSCDPISLLRGAGGHEGTPEARAETRQVAVRFIEFLLSEEGQKLWTYRHGEYDASGKLLGPEKYTLRRLPIRRSFYPSTNPAVDAASKEHQKHAADDLADPTIDPYTIAQQFTYYPRWTGSHFGPIREIIRSMCMDSAGELKAAYGRLRDQNADPRTATLGGLPAVRLTAKDGTEKDWPLTWRTAPDIVRQVDGLVYSRAWTEAFRAQYDKVAREN